jgi:hypothetical protein
VEGNRRVQHYSSSLKMGTCALCGNEDVLEDSHIIPSFVFKWIKSTSGSGFLRKGINPNKPVQDGPKEKLLCGKCEDLLSKLETKFSKEIFHPYVTKELDSNGTAQGKIKSFQYADWLLRFILSVHWRVLVAETYFQNTAFNSELENQILTVKTYWQEFLLGKRRDSGANETHLIFLQSLESVVGKIPESINDSINYYLLRSVDATPVIGKNTLAMYTKIGPMAFFTTINPQSLKNAGDSKIRIKGQISTVQKINNDFLANFIFITRPNETLPTLRISDQQRKKIAERHKIDPNKVKNSLTHKAKEADLQIRLRKLLRKYT